MTPERIARHCENQAASCDRLGSPFTARLCRALPKLLDGTTKTGKRVSDWPGNPAADALALRLCGGLHALVLDGADPELAGAYPPNAVADAALDATLSGAIGRHDARLARFLDSPPQTNEIARSAMLLPGFLLIARETGMPLALNEIGSSAGLNLLFDRFSYRYSGGLSWGADSPVRIEAAVAGGPPPLGGDLAVASRHGCDIAPVDVADPAARLRLRSYVWPDQPHRLQRIDAAIALAEETTLPLDRADALDFVSARLAARREGEAFVLFHSIMWQYMPEWTRDAVARAMEEAGRGATRSAPIAWLRMEPVRMSDPFATLALTLWPGGGTRALANCDYHGRSIDWIG